MHSQERILRKLQEHCIEVLFKFDEICRRYNLRYYLAYGTLLGAVRHNGFIPWDDDIDLYMPRKDLEELITHHLEEFTYPYRVNYYTSEYYKSFSFNLRIGNQKAQIKRIIGEKEYFIDAWISIFPIDDAPNSRVKRWIFDKGINIRYLFLRLVRSAHNGIGNVEHSKFETVVSKINEKFRFFNRFSIKNAASNINEYLKKNRGCDSEYVAVYSYGENPLYYRKKWFEQVEMIMYEGNLLPCPSGYKEILAFCYGDYMKLPPLDQQIPQHGIDVKFEEST